MQLNSIHHIDPRSMIELKGNQAPTIGGQENIESFGTLLKNTLEHVNEAQLQSDQLTTMLTEGQPIELHEVMIASQKASIMMDTALEIRNKAVEAYQEMMRMQV